MVYCNKVNGLAIGREKERERGTLTSSKTKIGLWDDWFTTKWGVYTIMKIKGANDGINFLLFLKIWVNVSPLGRGLYVIHWRSYACLWSGQSATYAIHVASKLSGEYPATFYKDGKNLKKFEKKIGKKLKKIFKPKLDT